MPGYLLGRLWPEITLQNKRNASPSKQAKTTPVGTASPQLSAVQRLLEAWSVLVLLLVGVLDVAAVSSGSQELAALLKIVRPAAGQAAVHWAPGR